MNRKKDIEQLFRQHYAKMYNLARCILSDDDEIYGQAIHYYEEKDIEVGKPLNCQVSVNHHIELTEEEKAQARQEAIRQYQQEQMNKMRNRDTAKRTSQRTETEVHQPSLFDTLWNQERNIRSKS